MDDRNFVRVFMMREGEDAPMGAGLRLDSIDGPHMGVDFDLWGASMEQAAKERNVEATRELAAEVRWAQGVTPLMAAAERGRPGCVTALLEMDGAGSAGERDEAGFTALTWAARGGSERCVEELLPMSDMSLRDNGGWTALIWAAAEGRFGVVEVLVKDATLEDLMVADKNGCTALTMAAVGGRMRCVNVLVKALERLMPPDEWAFTVADAADAADQMNEYVVRDFLRSRFDYRVLEAAIACSSKTSEIKRL